MSTQSNQTANLSKYKCLSCGSDRWRTYSTIWICELCGKEYPCDSGIPRLYIESDLGERDKWLRDRFYNDFLGTYYQRVMPFMSLPVRPARANWKGWLV